MSVKEHRSSQLVGTVRAQKDLVGFFSDMH